ncbi:uncharacterized protein LACBIDRAFT_315821 [Laccaria bicolor S238N-H82]|uniref:Histone H1 n=1 Tax=Laccaria bicolor (strain S238N-H82 / ATCC MYA-4686) TaxID=486041 RepID=B0D395_LACBS|nr:uncharacterized protein LACBIDRAFT_315821 [Laccaria bicolor S238N-H82]EDR10875.1 predicted protein [Laccaria bicolor S238N-H82]|eukprot:XP_001878176.1 predicted protein [Laccaria bicolor S238N-H82]
MQVASSSLVPTTTYPAYHNSYYPALTAPQDFDLKRQYLALLPPQQIIEICLTFDAYVPPYAKTTIWPPDINAAIAALQKPPPTDDSQTPAGPQTTAIMDSLGPSANAPSAPSKAAESPSEPQPPDREASATPGPSSAPVASTSTADQNSTATRPVYPQQPYGYGHSQTAYPHAPYYPPPPAGYPYPSYPGYPPMSNGYTAQGYPPTATSLYNTSALAQGPDGPHADDLPSYEEMIVEALTDSGDPEGCAPKDLFFWMASRYPLQSNFRPSASQALQKAFKRGRFEKSSGGKYRLNATWEGGSTTRRTTRRPQTHSQPQAAGATSGSPFTHAPLVHHHSTTAQAQQPYQNSYGYPYSHYGYPPQPQATPAPQPEKPPAPPPTTGDVSDAYEAAQNILKAINFGNLLQLPPEETNDGATPDQPPSSPPKENNVSAMPTSPADVPVEQPHPRAELQAHLALLVAQLAELAQADGEWLMQEVDPPPPVVQPPPPAPPPVVLPPPPALPPPVLAVPEEDEDSDDGDMEEVA